jgi:flagellar capping protein FliD
VSSSSVPGTNVPPITFPGIVSGINYDSIISKLTSLTLAQNVTLNAQIATLNAANAELIKINNLLTSVQQSLGALSDPSIFSSYSATSSNSAEGSASAIPGALPISGSYTILNQVAATATTVTNNPADEHSITDTLTSGPYAGQASNTVPLIDSYAAVTPTNGGAASGLGTITVNGVQVTYNVNTQSLNTILANIQSAVQAGTGDTSFTASLNANGEVVLSSTNHPITLGSPSDSGNLLDVLQLSTAQVNNTGSGGTVTGTGNVGGINQAAAFNSTTDAGNTTPVTSGFFTINGVQISVSAANDNTASVIARINASNAGVIASYNAPTNQITLTATATGPQNIILGSGSDTSNFLTAAGLTPASGAKTTVGTQAEVQVQGPSGATTTVYSNSNAVTNAIAGVQLNIGNFTGPYTITVGQDNSQLISAVNTFVSAYNAAISEINFATEPPAVITPTPGSSTTATSASIGGGVLWSNSNIEDVKNELTSMVSGFFGAPQMLDSQSYTNPTPQYDSLAAIGLQLSDSFSVLSTSSTSGANSNTSSSNPVSTQQMQGTDGTLQPLNSATLLAALQANPSDVQQIFQGANSITNQLGNYLGQVTGLPTLLNNGLVGLLPPGGTATIQGFENTNNDSIASIQQQITQVTNNANMQANTLRQEFVSSETLLAEYQSMQQQLGSFFKSSGS